MSSHTSDLLDGDQSQGGGAAAAGRTDLALSRFQPRIGDLPASAAIHVPSMVRPSDKWAVLAISALRRRWIVVLVAGVLAGAVAGMLGWKLIKPAYRSIGLVRIAYTLPPVLQVTDQNQPMQMFETFMQSQQLLITSRRVIDMAVEDPVWRATGREVPADPAQYFAQNLKVTIRPGSEFIEISVTDADPGTAAAAVNSIINAYVDQYNTQSKELERERLGVLDDAQNNLEQEVGKLDSRISDGIAKYGTSDLRSFYDDAAARVSKVKSAIDDTRAAIAVAPSVPRASADPLVADAPSQRSSDLSDEQIAATDPTMRQYMEERDHLADELKRLQFLGYGDQHQEVIIAKWNLRHAEQRVGDYGNQVRVFQSATGGDFVNRPAASAGSNAPIQKSVDQLQADLVNLTKLYEQEKAEMVTWGTEEKTYEDLNRQAASDRDQLAALSHRMEVLRTEDSLGGRLSINSTGEIPLSPERDRRITVAALGAVGGAVFPAGLCVLAALVGSRKYLYSEETEVRVNAKAPLLGIVPALNGGGHDAEAEAAHSIHQIRVTLRSLMPRDGVCVFLLTSASPSEGKTSLTMSLGLSFAAARLRTLIIDCDLVGCQLTRALHAHDTPGLRDALVGHNLKDLVKKAGANLFVLPAGRTSISPNSLSTGEIRELLSEARKDFDIVLIDTGPILSSVEAAVLAQEVDGVVVVIGRGQQRSLVARAIRRLDSLGARVEGFVFNRAQGNDFQRSSFGSSSHRSSVGGETPKIGATRLSEQQALKGFGPLVQAVAAGLPHEA